MKWGLTLDTSPLKAAFKSAPERTLRGVKKGIYRSALNILNESQKLVPVGGPPTSPYDKHIGSLKASGTVSLPKQAGNVVSISISYGGRAKAYAYRQHQDLTFKHKPGQQAK